MTKNKTNKCIFLSFLFRAGVIFTWEVAGIAPLFPGSVRGSQPHLVPYTDTQNTMYSVKKIKPQQTLKQTLFFA